MDRVDEIVESFKRNNADVKYVLNENGKMTNIEFEYSGCKSYIDVIEKDNTYKIICYGDYKTFVLGSNWWHVYLDDIGTRDFNLDYVASKVEAGEAYEFEADKFRDDVHEYFEENGINKDTYREFFEDRDVEYYLNEVSGRVEAVEFINMCDDELGLAIWEVAGKWGYKLTKHFIIWVAIIKYAQEKLQEDKE